MKIHVSYTYKIDSESLADLIRYHGEKLTRDTIRQLLINLGKSGVEEQIYQGHIWRTTIETS